MDLSEIDVRVIDQRIGAGVGGYDTVIRLLHKPTGIIIEIPRITSSQHKDREAALGGMQAILTRLGLK